MQHSGKNDACFGSQIKTETWEGRIPTYIGG